MSEPMFRFEPTGEVRKPNKGEWYFDPIGLLIEAPHDIPAAREIYRRVPHEDTSDPAPITPEALAGLGVERYFVEEYYGAREEANLVMWEPLADGGVNIMVNFATVNITTLGQLTALLLALEGET